MIDTSATLEIASIAAGGDGDGRAEVVVVFVPRTAPGDIRASESLAQSGSLAVN